MPTIAVIGASPDRSKFGNKCVRAYALRGYTVYPVNPTAAEIEGRPAYRDVLEVPEDRLDRISVYLPPQIALGVLDGIAGKPAGEVWLNPGVDRADVVARARELGLNVVVGCSIVDIGISPSELA